MLHAPPRLRAAVRRPSRLLGSSGARSTHSTTPAVAAACGATARRARLAAVPNPTAHAGDAPHRRGARAADPALLHLPRPHLRRSRRAVAPARRMRARGRHTHHGLSPRTFPPTAARKLHRTFARVVLPRAPDAYDAGARRRRRLHRPHLLPAPRRVCATQLPLPSPAAAQHFPLAAGQAGGQRADAARLLPHVLVVGAALARPVRDLLRHAHPLVGARHNRRRPTRPRVPRKLGPSPPRTRSRAAGDAIGNGQPRRNMASTTRAALAQGVVPRLVADASSRADEAHPNYPERLARSRGAPTPPDATAAIGGAACTGGGTIFTSGAAVFVCACTIGATRCQEHTRLSAASPSPFRGMELTCRWAIAVLCGPCRFATSSAKLASLARSSPFRRMEHASRWAIAVVCGPCGIDPPCVDLPCELASLACRAYSEHRKRVTAAASGEGDVAVRGEDGEGGTEGDGGAEGDGGGGGAGSEPTPTENGRISTAPRIEPFPLTCRPARSIQIRLAARPGSRR